jgi:VIT family
VPENWIQQLRNSLDPQDRILEVLFGLIMVLTFTGSLSATEAGREEVRTMLIGALGCNLAWGLIDAIMYLMTCLSERGRGILTFRAVRKATNPTKANGIIADAMPPLLASVLQPAELEMMRQRLSQLPEPPERPRLTWPDFKGAITVFCLVFLCTFPVAIPFLFMHDTMVAMRTSNGIAVVMLFVLGYYYGRLAGYPAWRTGLAMVLIGCILVALTIALGG